MISILVTGSNGQLGSAMRQLAENNSHFAFTFMDIQDMDLTHEALSLQYFENHHFNYIINCAAYTAVDQAEEQTSKAFAVNAGIPVLLGKICNNSGTRLIHLSTDYVYNGSVSTPHLESDTTHPQSVYAKSKLEGEKELWAHPNVIIIRTSWLYSEFGNNFLKTMIKLGKERDHLHVVYDQTGSPTYAGDLAGVLLQIIESSENKGFLPGIYNYSNEGVCSWYDFAVEIMRLLNSSCRIFPIRSSAYPLPAKRPEYSVMDKQKIKTTFDLEIPYWKDSLITALNNLQNTHKK